VNVATLCDRRYCVEGVVCAQSASTQGADLVFILCLDRETRDVAGRLLDSKGPVIIPVRDLEDYYPVLRELRSQRDWKSYVAALKPFYLGYLLEFFGIEVVAMVDSDMFFWGPVAEIDRVMGDAGILVIDRELDPPPRCGWFNDGFVVARPSGLPFVRWWQERCTEWCQWMTDGGGDRFGAEGYLNVLHDQPGIFPFAKWVQHSGINLAPWNARWHRLNDGDQGFTVDDEFPLICYHYRDFQDFRQTFWEEAPIAKEYLDALYRPYYDRLREVAALIEEAGLKPVD